MCALLLLCGCAPVSEVVPPAADALTVRPEPVAPFVLSVTDERFDGEAMAISFRIEPRAWWDPQRVTLSYRGLSETGPRKPLSVSLFEVIPHAQFTAVAGVPLIAADKPLEGVMVVPAAGITDYELVISWGRQARDEVVVVVQRIEVEELLCAHPPCEMLTALAGVVINEGEQPISTVTVGLNLRDPGGAPLHEGEISVTLDVGTLRPQESAPFRIDVDTPLPRAVAESVTPGLRVIEYR